jgi:hypothetical protein
MGAQSNREIEIFNSALERTTPAERAAYLDGACGEDAELRARIEVLLCAHEQAGGFLPTEDAKPQAAELAQTFALTTDRVPLTEKVGDRIGRYKLLQQIGEGGCGVVYMAEQQEPVRRKVALKVIKLGMDTKNVIARFEAERQALALMDHPNIAKVLDAGATDTGRPYFVMELVHGTKITNYCDANNLDITTRLNLFIQICQAIQHAHQKGIIHRDIKPSNILVTLRDGVPVPKVIDFGIAKATTEQRLTDKTVFTAFEQFMGTPAYMSPEQAEMSEQGIDTRSDIYSLGILLYELLTGGPPFDAKQLLQSGLDAMRKTIRETEPPRPSTKLGTMLAADLTAVAQRHGAESPKLIHLIRGDLDWIVMKSLEKDRTRRYETANGLSMDVQRHLGNEPVLARPPSNLYRLQKMARRNKLAFASCGAVALALVLGIVASTWQAVRATRAEKEQVRLRQRAEGAERQESQLRQKAEANEIITRATVAYDERHFDKVEKLVDEVPAALFQEDPVRVRDMLYDLANWEGGENRLSQADAHFALFVSGAADRGSLEQRWDHQTMAYTEYAPVLVELDEVARYEKLRDTALKIYGDTTNSAIAERMLSVSLLLPANREQLSVLEKLAQLASRTNPRDTKFAPWAYTALALFEYRRGHFEQSADWCQKALSFGEFAARSPRTHLLSAMAAYQLEHVEQARAELAPVRKIMADKLTGKLGVGNWEVTGGWHDWIINRILFREALKLMETPPLEHGSKAR